MSVILNDYKSVSYLNLNKVGTTEPRDAVISATFKDPIVERATDYFLSIERASVPLQAMPYLSAAQLTGLPTAPANEQGWSIRVFLNNSGNNSLIQTTLGPVWGISELLGDLNSIVWNPVQATPPFSIYLTEDGKVRLEVATDNLLELNGLLPYALGFNTNSFTATPQGHEIFISDYPCMDLVDQVEKIQIDCIGLPAKSERYQDGTREAVITDFLVPRSYSLSTTHTVDSGAPQNIFSFSYNPRQTIQFIPKVRRFIEMQGDAPVRELRLRALVVYKDGSKEVITLPNRATFSIKLGLYRR